MPQRKVSFYQRFNVGAYMKQKRLASEAVPLIAEKKRKVDAKRKHLKRLDDKVTIIFLFVQTLIFSNINCLDQLCYGVLNLYLLL